MLHTLGADGVSAKVGEMGKTVERCSRGIRKLPVARPLEPCDAC